jgi:hypothetical protein
MAQINIAQNDDLSKMLDDSSTSNSKIKVAYTFKTSRLINLATNEQVKKGELDFRIAHRFGDIAGSGGGASTFFGFDQIADIRFSFDYGLSDRWAIGIGRSKGAYQQQQIFDLTTKYKILEQETNGMPLGVSFNGGMTFTTMESSIDPAQETYFKKSTAHRINYYGQAILVKKISSRLSVVFSPTFVHRNLVTPSDLNMQFALGIGARIKTGKRAAIIADFYQIINRSRLQNTSRYLPPIGLGYELETGGHVFHVLLSNNRGLVESQFITSNREDVTLGQLRLGFNISRVFNILK